MLQDDWPQTDVVARVACEALFYLGFDDVGRWSRNAAVIVNFLKQETGKFPSARDLNDLKAMLESDPVDRRSIKKWFEMVY